MSKQTARHPWHIDAEKAGETFPEYDTTATSTARVFHQYKDIWHSTPSHKEWRALPDEILFRTEPGNPALAIERLALFLQSVIGPPGLEPFAASKFLRTLFFSGRPAAEHTATMAVALDKVLASNGGRAATITLARTASGFDFERQPRRPVYVRFQQDVADTTIDVDRYPDDRSEGRSAGTQQALLGAIRRIQANASDPPVEVELALRSDRMSAELSVGVEIRDDPTLPELYRRNDR